MYRAAMRCILAELVRQERLLVVEAFTVAAAKTKAMVAKMTELGLVDALVVTDSLGQDLYLASRNIPRVNVVDVVSVNPVSLIANAKVVMTVPALKQIEEWLA
jgi:large subunit ribosomal protein L4